MAGAIDCGELAVPRESRIFYQPPGLDGLTHYIGEDVVYNFSNETGVLKLNPKFYAIGGNQDVSTELFKLEHPVNLTSKIDGESPTVIRGVLAIGYLKPEHRKGTVKLAGSRNYSNSE